MSERSRWRTVGIVLGAGAVYDFVFGVAILAFTRLAARILGLQVPADPLYLFLNGVLLLVLGTLYAAAAIEPKRYSAVAPISAGGRALGFLLFAWGWKAGHPAVFLALGLIDLGLAVATVVAWRRAARLSD